MSKQLQDAYIVAATRTPIGKAPRGMFKTTRPDDLLVRVIQSAMQQAPGLDPNLITQLLDPLPGSESIINTGARLAMANAIHLVFLIAFVAAALALVATAFTPRKDLAESAAAVSSAPAD